MASRVVVLFTVVPLAFVFSHSLMLAVASSSSPDDSPSLMCDGARAPVVLAEPLAFCSGYGSISCCDTVDAELRKEFDDSQRRNAGGSTCPAAVKALLCARCVPYLSSVVSNPNTADTIKLLAPLLCASTSSTSVQQHPTPTTRPQDMCLERISTDGSYLTMAAHPDGSSRAILSTKDGKIWLAFGLKGVAFHPDFATNGRFFVSSTGAAGRCRSAAPAPGNGCSKYQLVVDEFSEKGGVAVERYNKNKAAPSQVRRVFSMDLPRPHRLYSYQQHGGQLLFKPGESDGYLYLVTGHGVFDAESPANLYCANVDEQHKERVYLISKGGGSSSEAAVPTLAINHGRPADGRMPSIVGGLVYHGSADPALQKSLQVRSSPAHYRGTVITGRVLSMAEDNSKDIFILATGSVYRVVPPGLCNHVPLHQQTQWPPGTGWVLSFGALAVAFAFYLIWSTIFGGQTISLFNGFRLSFLLNFCIIDNRTISANNFPTTADHQD
ncbi:hypothetical protein QOZ80_5BG0442160 [Eleusine coracana subsp. coracana]|nr:hypothetical protein QOZ80_5BG0442160 [Eleusine coracana subsp. coracana]